LAKKLSPDQTWADVILSNALVEAGRLEECRAILDELLRRSKSHFVPPIHIALVYSNLGDKERALEWLEKACDSHDPKMTFLKTDWMSFDACERAPCVMQAVYKFPRPVKTDSWRPSKSK